MNLDVDFLIDFFRKHTPVKKNTPLDEQDAPEAAPAPAPAPASAPAGGSTGAAPAGKTPKKWESGVKRGQANQIGNTKWESGRTLGKTYMNDPHYQWTSGRQMGKTGGSDY